MNTQTGYDRKENLYLIFLYLTKNNKENIKGESFFNK